MMVGVLKPSREPVLLTTASSVTLCCCEDLLMGCKSSNAPSCQLMACTSSLVLLRRARNSILRISHARTLIMESSSQTCTVDDFRGQLPLPAYERSEFNAQCINAPEPMLRGNSLGSLERKYIEEDIRLEEEIRHIASFKLEQARRVLIGKLHPRAPRSEPRPRRNIYVIELPPPQQRPVALPGEALLFWFKVLLVFALGALAGYARAETIEVQRCTRGGLCTTVTRNGGEIPGPGWWRVEGESCEGGVCENDVRVSRGSEGPGSWKAEDQAVVDVGVVGYLRAHAGVRWADWVAGGG